MSTGPRVVFSQMLNSSELNQLLNNTGNNGLRKRSQQKNGSTCLEVIKLYLAGRSKQNLEVRV